MMTKSNFEFLKGVNDFTYAIACAAENNYRMIPTPHW